MSYMNKILAITVICVYVVGCGSSKPIWDTARHANSQEQEWWDLGVWVWNAQPDLPRLPSTCEAPPIRIQDLKPGTIRGGGQWHLVTCNDPGHGRGLVTIRAVDDYVFAQILAHEYIHQMAECAGIDGHHAHEDRRLWDVNPPDERSRVSVEAIWGRFALDETKRPPHTGVTDSDPSRGNDVCRATNRML